MPNVCRPRCVWIVIVLGLFLSANVAAQVPRPPDGAEGGTVLMLGDSIFDLHEGDKRIEVILKDLLARVAPQTHWTIYNEAHGGEYVGPKEGSPTGVSDPLFSSETTGRYFEIVQRRPQANVIFVNYGGNDSKVYPPATFRLKLEKLATHLQRDYPGATLIFSTTMYLDPKHSAPYVREDPKVPGFKNGGSRNQYLDPYNREIRKFVKERHYRLADIYRRLERETKRGNWDLRQRGEGDGSPSEDRRHAADMAWFSNIHPNDEGTRVIADVLIRALMDQNRNQKK